MADKTHDSASLGNRLHGPTAVTQKKTRAKEMPLTVPVRYLLTP